jgi:hypothetical protein
VSYYYYSPYPNVGHSINWARLQQNLANQYQARFLVQQEQQYEKDLADQKKELRRQERHRHERHLADKALHTYKFAKEHPEVVDLAKDAYKFVKEHPEVVDLAKDVRDKVWAAAQAARDVRPESATATDKPKAAHPGRRSDSTRNSSRPAGSSSASSARVTQPPSAEPGVDVIFTKGGTYNTAAPQSGDCTLRIIHNPDGTYHSAA